MPDAPRIACLGWGSLIAEPRTLPVVGGWRGDGPPLPLEFARQSGDGRMTLVIVDNEAPVTTLWTLLGVQDLDQAVRGLAEREGANVAAIGRWPSVGRERRHAAEIGRWAEEQRLDGVVWTDLKAGFADARGPVPTLAEVKGYLAGLTGGTRAAAARYVLTTPTQVQTPWRRELEALLG